jgi:23S rRNA (guanosine2251-2'-O)-methyltransferase
MKKQEIPSVVYGIHPVIELLKAKKRKMQTIYTTDPEPKAWSEIVPLLPPYVNVKHVTKETLTKIAQTADHQSVVALAAPFVFRKKFFDSKTSPFLIMLDGIQDPRNLGAILRSSYCSGIKGVIVTSKSSSPLNEVVLKSSAGLAEHLEIYQTSSIQNAITELKAAGYNIYLATLDGQDAIDVKYELPLCLVIGNEAIGISKNILSQGIKIRLPQVKSDISYNASVAAGILMFNIAHQKKII